MTYIPEGCVLLARKIKQSDIWQAKPSWWLKVWVYILMQVNHKDNKLFKRGENFFTYEQIYNDCHLVCEGNDTKSLDNLMRWLKSTTQITTRKTTRGFIISVCKYDLYQDMTNYKNDTEIELKNESKTTEKRHRNDTINNNVNNDNNTISRERISTIITKFIEIKGWKDSIKDNKALLNDIYKRNVRPAKELILAVNDDKRACEAIATLAERFKPKNLDWKLETVIRHLPELLKPKEFRQIL